MGRTSQAAKAEDRLAELASLDASEINVGPVPGGNLSPLSVPRNRG
jgi:hypothetical protein